MGEVENYSTEESQPQYLEQYYEQQQQQPTDDANLYYEGQLQPGEQYYANDETVESYPTETQPIADNAYYNEYDSGISQPVEEMYAPNPGLESEQPTNVNVDYDAENRLNVSEPTNWSDEVQAPNYLVSDTEGSLAPNILKKDPEQSESDFDFSAT